MLSSFWTLQVTRAPITSLFAPRTRPTAQITSPFVTHLCTIGCFAKHRAVAIKRRFAVLITGVLGYAFHITAPVPTLLIAWLERWFHFRACHFAVLVALLFTRAGSGRSGLTAVDCSLRFAQCPYNRQKKRYIDKQWKKLFHSLLKGFPEKTTDVQ